MEIEDQPYFDETNVYECVDNESYQLAYDAEAECYVTRSLSTGVLSQGDSPIEAVHALVSALGLKVLTQQVIIEEQSKVVVQGQIQNDLLSKRIARMESHVGRGAEHYKNQIEELSDEIQELRNQISAMERELDARRDR